MKAQRNKQRDHVAELQREQYQHSEKADEAQEQATKANIEEDMSISQLLQDEVKITEKALAEQQQRNKEITQNRTLMREKPDEWDSMLHESSEKLVLIQHELDALKKGATDAKILEGEEAKTLRKEVKKTQHRLSFAKDKYQGLDKEDRIAAEKEKLRKLNQLIRKHEVPKKLVSLANQRKDERYTERSEEVNALKDEAKTHKKVLDYERQKLKELDQSWRQAVRFKTYEPLSWAPPPQQDPAAAA